MEERSPAWILIDGRLCCLEVVKNYSLEVYDCEAYVHIMAGHCLWCALLLGEHKSTLAVNSYFWVLSKNDEAISENVLMPSNSMGDHGKDPNFIARVEELLGEILRKYPK